MPLTKTKLAATLAERMGLSKREAKDVVTTFYDEICLALESGKSVNLAGFGALESAAESDGLVASAERITRPERIWYSPD